jgi:hypothetical protein
MGRARLRRTSSLSDATPSSAHPMTDSNASVFDFDPGKTPADFSGQKLLDL